MCPEIDSESHEMEPCDECGKFFPKSQLRTCDHCGAVLCPECQKDHDCFSETETTPEPVWEPVSPRQKSPKKKFIIIGIIVLLCVAAGIGLALNADNIADSFKPDPHIVLDKSATGEKRSIVVFDVGSGSTESVTVKADAKVYYGAQLPQSRELGSGNYWVMMTEDEAQNDFYDSLISQFNVIKGRQEFTDDQYVEMVTSFVQTISYDPAAADMPQYPVVTAIDKMGDCDEKSMLLAGILARAGYDVALLDFEGEEHMTAGIKTTDGTGYGGGYGVIETTYEGWYVTEDDRASKSVTSYIGTGTQPLVYPIGNGTKTYGSASQVRSIVSYFNSLDNQWNSIESGVDSSLNKANETYERYLKLSEEREEVNSQMAQLNHQYTTSSISYSTYESRWDTLENKYYALTEEMDKLWDQYQSSYNSYANTLDSRNDWADLYNTLSKVCPVIAGIKGIRNDWADLYNTLSKAKVCDRYKMYILTSSKPLYVQTMSTSYNLR